ncbi:MAG: 30S ribosome-binding factor RbfA [Firmicutes bacterium]|nr:30S ribosome-binding factor RbfA [Bacillota bacterium]
MKKNSRIDRIDDELKREISEIIRSDLKDPRVGAVVSVLRADMTADFKYCKVYVSILGDGKAKKETMDALKSASGFVRKLLAERVNLRLTPELAFILDDSMEYGFRMNRLIDEVARNAGERHSEITDKNPVLLSVVRKP